MAPVEKKRKNDPTNKSFVRSRKPTTDGDDRPSKRLRPDEEGRTATAAKIPHVPKISRIREEEAAFPRGGASVLTPLEHKQIQIDATRDVLFEQQSGKTAGANVQGDEEDSRPSKKKLKSKGKSKKEKVSKKPEEETVKVEGLSYKVHYHNLNS